MLAINEQIKEERAERGLRALYRESQRESVVQQIGPEATGEWYLVRCEPGRDLTVKRWLGDRRKFGVFLPMNGLQRVLPGWIAAYVFDMPAMIDRICDCPGVVGVLHCERGRPKVLSMEFILSMATAAWVGKAPPSAKKSDKPKRTNPKNRKALRKAKKAAKRAKLSRRLDVSAQITAYRHRPRELAAL